MLFSNKQITLDLLFGVPKIKVICYRVEQKRTVLVIRWLRSHFRILFSY